MDSPHANLDNACFSCHLDHDLLGNQIGSTAGNANVCLSCHQTGGIASRKSLAETDQAKLWPDAPAQPQSGGNSHRWDASPSGRVQSVSGAPASALVPGGSYTGRYAATYLITITGAGDSGSALFNWTGTGPGTGAGMDTLTGSGVPLELGLTLSFRNTRPTPSFSVGDQWRIYVRSELQFPTNQNMLGRLDDGKVVCSTCHNQHFQQAEPFDPSAPPYVPGQGNGRHCMRAPNDTDQMCRECHASKFVTNALAGSHPIGLLVTSNAMLHPPSSLPLDKNEHRFWCSSCHQLHQSASRDGTLLRMASEQELCSQCHALANTLTPAVHLNPVNGPLWPGGQYGSLLSADTNSSHRGGCGNCHRVHGWPVPGTGADVYPSLLVEREENLCYTCHNGTQSAKNMVANFSKTYRHPVASYTGRHSSTEDGKTASYGTANRHSECVDCHNPHQLDTDFFAPVAPAASSKLRGVARVSVTNYAVNSISYTFRGASDPKPVKEYELCFLCHSGWTSRPSGQADYAAKFNTRNASFHPVESVGKNLNINANSFVNGWNATKMMTCTDCHTSDDSSIAGPHGSAYRYILKKSATASPASRTMVSTELCFDCHRYDTYANSSATTTVKNYSRFGSGNGHAYHVGSRHYPCYTCHETHGATSQPNLLVTGRSPGITTYTRTASGGTCVATCHGSESYSVAYPR